MSNENHVILVDEQDNQIGTEEKMAAHENGARLHRAFSIFIFNQKKELMLQRRAAHKYHSGGLWTNTCCSHQRPGETTIEAAHRRLQEEMGFDTDLEEVFSFIYRAELDHGLTEHEFDHVVVGYFEDDPILNLEETDQWKWISLDELQRDIKNHPEQYTEWFKIILRESIEKLRSVIT